MFRELKERIAMAENPQKRARLKVASLSFKKDSGPVAPNTGDANETDGELAVRQVAEKLKEVAKGDPAVSSSPDMDEPVVSRTSPMGMEGPKFPWTKGPLLGKGGFGTVYKAVDCDGRVFAVKEVTVIKEDRKTLRALELLKQEVELMKNLKHRNIVRYLGTHQGADELYIFLELAESGSLEKVYKESGLTDSQVSKSTRDILRGLEYLHDQKVLHRDIKCANVLVNKMGTCLLADFGLAKQFSTLNPAKSRLGTGKWMAPEVITAKDLEPYGPPADIWSLGCSVLEMATRAPPFPELTWVEAMLEVGNGNAPPIPDTLSESLREFIERCLEIEPKKRATVAELLQLPFIVQGH